MISVFINSLTSGGAEKVVLTLLERFRYSGNPLELVLIEKELSYEKYLNGRVFIETKAALVNLVKKPQKKKSPLHQI